MLQLIQQEFPSHHLCIHFFFKNHLERVSKFLQIFFVLFCLFSLPFYEANTGVFLSLFLICCTLYQVQLLVQQKGQKSQSFLRNAYNQLDLKHISIWERVHESSLNEEAFLKTKKSWFDGWKNPFFKLPDEKLSESMKVPIGEKKKLLVLFA